MIVLRPLVERHHSVEQQADEDDEGDEATGDEEPNLCPFIRLRIIWSSRAKRVHY